METITISPSMSDQELFAYWSSLRNLRRKFLTYKDVTYQIELSPEAQSIVQNRRRLKMRASFDRYLEGHREAYNKIYRERYHILKARKQQLLAHAEGPEELVIQTFEK